MADQKLGDHEKRNVRLRFAAALTTLLTLQVLSAADQDPLAVSDALQFDQTELGLVQAGYLTLSWNQVAGAVEYRVQGDAEWSIYCGPFTQAFLSGLADGHYQFRVHALNDQGIVIASSQVPAEVTVEHWALPMALALFACGLVVFLVIIAVLVRGTWMNHSASTAEAPR